MIYLETNVKWKATWILFTFGCRLFFCTEISFFISQSCYWSLHGFHWEPANSQTEKSSTKLLNSFRLCFSFQRFSFSRLSKAGKTRWWTLLQQKRNSKSFVLLLTSSGLLSLMPLLIKSSILCIILLAHLFSASSHAHSSLFLILNRQASVIKWWWWWVSKALDTLINLIILRVTSVRYRP